MRIPSIPRRANQLALFQSGPRAPRWGQLPLEVRQHTVRLLARMLNKHLEGGLACPSTREAGDE